MLSERTGVKQSLRPKAVAVSSVSLAMYAEPLSDNHSTGCAALLIPKSTPESNGIAEAFVKTFKRDYARLSILPDVLRP